MKVEKSFLDPLEKIMEKKEFSRLPREDVLKVYSLFSNNGNLEEIEKIKKTRDILRKMYTAFLSEKLLKIKDGNFEWFLKKHISTAERKENYEQVYNKIFQNLKKQNSSTACVFDFGCGINGFSYPFFSKINLKIKYFGTESVGQLCDLQNVWFKKNNFDGEIKWLSLFNLEKNNELIIKNKCKTNNVGFFFKVLDSLEMVERDYSKKVLNELVPLLDFVVVSWATKSLIRKRNFHANRKWLRNFIFASFFVLDEFEIGGENYIIFSKKDKK